MSDCSARMHGDPIFRLEVELTERNGILYPVNRGDGTDREFLGAYRAIRQEEGRGSDDPEYYLRLPEGEFTGERRGEWRERGRSLSWLVQHYGGSFQGSRILDAGAGNCWLTHHLARLGAEVIALDIDDGEYDGLGAGRHMIERGGVTFTRLCASFEHLPLEPDCFDFVIFNGAIHYADDAGAVIAEGARIARPNGRVIIMDTPVYHSRRSGEAMLAERGGPQRAGFLTFGALREIAATENLWLEVIPRYPLAKRIVGSLRHRLRLGREPASMPWIVYSLLPENPKR